VVTIRITSLKFTNSTFCSHNVFMCFVWIWEQTAIISLYTINWLVFITQKECVYCTVRTGSLNVINANLFFLQRQEMVIPGVVTSPITCFGSILQCGVLRTYREAIAAQHAGVESQRPLQQRLAPPDDGQQLPCPRLTLLQLKSQLQFTLHKLQDHQRPVSPHNSPIISHQAASRIKSCEGNGFKLLFRQVFGTNH